jgi:hypothetical protein
LDNPTVECHDIEPKFIKDDEQTIVVQDYAIKCSKGVLILSYENPEGVW